MCSVVIGLVCPLSCVPPARKCAMQNIIYRTADRASATDAVTNVNKAYGFALNALQKPATRPSLASCRRLERVAPRRSIRRAEAPEPQRGAAASAVLAAREETKKGIYYISIDPVCARYTQHTSVDATVRTYTTTGQPAPRTAPARRATRRDAMCTDTHLSLTPAPALDLFLHRRLLRLNAISSGASSLMCR